MELTIITIIAETNLVSLETSYLVIENGNTVKRYFSGCDESLPPKEYYDFMQTAKQETIHGISKLTDNFLITAYYGSILKPIEQ